MKNIFLILLSLIFFSCSENLLKEDSAKSSELNLQLNSESRSILPSYGYENMIEFSLQGTFNGQNKILGQGKTFSELSRNKILLEQGTWTFVLSAKNQDSTFSDTVTKNILPGINHLSFNLQLADIGNKTGSINVSLSFPDNGSVKEVRAGLLNVNDNSEVSGFGLTSQVISSSTVIYKKQNIPAGTYWLIFKLYSEDGIYLNSYKEIITVSSDLECSAQRNIESINDVYTLDYNLNGGSFLSGTNQTSFTRLSSFSLPLNITRKGYNFLGWYNTADFTGDPITEIKKGTTGNINLYAKWSDPIVYSVSYSLNGGVFNEDSVSEYTVESPLLNFTIPEKRGYRFDGWYTESSLINKKNNITSGSFGDIKLYAKWTPVSYSITYYLNGGINSELNPSYYTIEDSDIILSPPVKSGSSFAGWFVNSNEIKKISTQNCTDVVLHAEWTTSDISISYKEVNDISVVQQRNEKNIIFTADSGYEYIWQVDNIVQPTNTNTFILNTENLVKGVYEIFLIASKNGDYKSATILVSVE